MQIREMNATFGKLKNDTLTLQPGLNCIYAPNESGKSTWSHFLRVMLYGINTRDRSPLADKHRFAPWAGWAMGGKMDLVTDEGEAITLRRDTARANAPMGNFSCTYTGTATPVAGIGKENAGEMLLGVGQEVFERSAFIRHSALVVDKDAELERRIASLITTGEEEISYSEVQGRLKKQLNRRRHNKTGLLPALETELSALQTQLAHIEDLRRQAYEAQQLLQQYGQQRQDLEETLEALPPEAAATTEKAVFEDCAILSAPVILQEAQPFRDGLETLIRICQERKCYFREEAAGRLKALLIRLVRTARLTDTAGDAMADRLIQYLRKHYRENLTVEQIAAYFNYHAGHINRVMRRSTGTTIHNYLVRCRMDAAKTLLLSTDMTVSQVAEEVGIESEAYFCNSFKKLTGITPKEYRRRAKNQ